MNHSVSLSMYLLLMASVLYLRTYLLFLGKGWHIHPRYQTVQMWPTVKYVGIPVLEPEEESNLIFVTL